MNTLRHLTAGAIAATLAVVSATAAAAGPGDGTPATSTMQAQTRAEVREDLKDARAMNTMTPAGEMGDTPDVLAAREAFNALQTEVFAARAVEESVVALLLLDHDF